MQEDIERIQQRNKRVEAEKAWEVSKTRKSFIAVITYVTAGLFLTSIDVSRPWVNALVPTGGYLISTLSLPLIKRWWLASIYKAK